MQYANTGPLPSHGFVRQRFWEIDTNPPQLPSNSYYKAWVDLILRSSQDDLKIWPHKLVSWNLSFTLCFRYIFGYIHLHWTLTQKKKTFTLNMNHIFFCIVSISRKPLYPFQVWVPTESTFGNWRRFDIDISC